MNGTSAYGRSPHANLVCLCASPHLAGNCPNPMQAGDLQNSITRILAGKVKNVDEITQQIMRIVDNEEQKK